MRHSDANGLADRDDAIAEPHQVGTLFERIVSRPGAWQGGQYSVQQRLKSYLESPAWRTPRIRERIMRLEAEAYV